MKINGKFGGPPFIGIPPQLLRIMKLTTIIMMMFFMQVSALTKAQITLKEKGTSLQKVLEAISKQSGYDLVYSSLDFENAKPVTLKLNDVSVAKALEAAFEGQPLIYEVSDRTVMIKKREKDSFFENLTPQLKAIDITGRVLDEKGQPLPGATVKVKDGKGGTMTDGQGRFLIENVSEGAVIVFSYTGYVNKEVVAKANMGTIIMALSENPLDQVQIIAYGTTSKRLSLSDNITVTAKEIEQQPVNNPLLALAGRVPGLQIMQQNGIAGGGITVRIQGRSNLDNTFVGSDPFYVIDRVPYASQNLSTFIGGGDMPILGSSSVDVLNSSANSRNYGNPLAFINPSDIESITVLKDADATAIYGSRAANGAILITTKKGRLGDIKTDFNLQQGWGQVPKKMDLLNSQQYMEMRREAKRNDGRPLTSSDYDLLGVWDTTRYTDWQKELIGGTASFTRLTASVSGGSDNMQYLVSSTYGRETTVFPGDFANTFGSLHFNLSTSSTSQRFKMQLGGSYMNNSNKLPAEDYTAYALNLPPVAPVLYNPDGSLNWEPDPLTGNSTWFNPLSRKYNLFETKTNNLVSNGSLSYRILPGLELTSTFGFTSMTSDQFTAALDESERPEFREDRSRMATFSFNTSRSWILEPQLTWQQKWGYHTLTTLVGSTFQYQNNNGRAFTAYDQTNDLLLRDMLAGTELATYGVDVNEYKYNAIFGRVNYSFRDKYLFNFSARRDGSSRFGPQSQFNNFGAVGVGWILSEEPFFKQSLPWLSFAKTRASYGTTGNDQIGNYRFMNLYSSFYTGISYQGVGTSEPIGLPNPNLEWEENRKLQGGIDLGFLKDRLLLTINYFRNRSSNSLTVVNMPLITGFGNLIQNIPALIQNTGWEISISTTNAVKGSLQWSSNINLTIPRNKLLAFPGLDFSPLKAYMTIGQPLSTLKSYPFYGVDPMTGLYLITNRNGEPTRSPGAADATIFLNTAPRWYGGFQNSIRYKKFSVDFLVQFTCQYGDNLIQLATVPGALSSGRASNLVTGNQPASVIERWQKPGDVRPYQRFATVSLSGVPGNLAYGNISFISLKNSSVSYQLNSTWAKKIKFQQLRLYANGQNLFTVTPYNGLDPEGRSVSSLPPLRMITFGIQATL